MFLVDLNRDRSTFDDKEETSWIRLLKYILTLWTGIFDHLFHNFHSFTLWKVVEEEVRSYDVCYLFSVLSRNLCRLNFHILSKFHVWKTVTYYFLYFFFVSSKGMVHIKVVRFFLPWTLATHVVNNKIE
jgi:hypothetical protein